VTFSSTPVWSVDTDRIRGTLDAIHEALQRPQVPVRAPSSLTLDVDHTRITATLNTLLDILNRRNLNASCTNWSMVPSPPGRDLVEHLHALMRSWKKRVGAIIGPQKGRLLDLLAQPIPDLLGVIQKAGDENAHSDVLRWLLDPREAKTIAPAALTKLVSFLDGEDKDKWQATIRQAIDKDSISVHREYIFGLESPCLDSRDRIDIVIRGPDFVLAIENKISSPEHEGQTAAYWRWLSTLPVRHAGFFLTPLGIEPECEKFNRLSYLQLLACLLEAPPGATNTAEQVMLAGYVKTLAGYVLRREIHTAKWEEL
jgi:hypothetical protein